MRQRHKSKRNKDTKTKTKKKKIISRGSFALKRYLFSLYVLWRSSLIVVKSSENELKVWWFPAFLSRLHPGLVVEGWESNWKVGIVILQTALFITFQVCNFRGSREIGKFLLIQDRDELKICLALFLSLVITVQGTHESTTMLYYHTIYLIS